jgi:hypothetical protein
MKQDRDLSFTNQREKLTGDRGSTTGIVSAPQLNGTHTMITQQQVIEQATADPTKRTALYRAIGLGLNYGREVKSGRNGFFANLRRQRRLTEIASSAASFVNKLRDADGNALGEEDQRAVYGWLQEAVISLVQQFDTRSFEDDNDHFLVRLLYANGTGFAEGAAR